MVNYNNIQYSETPYKHLIIDDFFNDAEIYKKIWDENGNTKNPLEIDGIDNHIEFQEYFTEHIQSDLLDKVEEYFGEVNRNVWVDSFNIQNQTWDQRFVDSDGKVVSDEYLVGRPSHIDGDSKKYPILIYFDDGSAEDGIPSHAGSFQLMDYKNPERVIKTIEFKNNRLVLFEASAISYHKFWCRPKNRLTLNIPLINDDNNHQLTQHYKI